MKRNPATAATIDGQNATSNQRERKGNRMLYEYLKQCLAYGSNNAISRKDIAAALDTNEKGLFALAQHEREAGRPICASHGGYFLPDINDTSAGRAELAGTTEQLRAKGLSMIRTARAMSDGYKKMIAAGPHDER